MSYTVGNWTIDLPVTDTISTPKNLPVPDLSYSADFSAGGTPSVQADQVQTIINTTGAQLLTAETIEYALSKLSNVYGGSGIPASLQADIKSGRKIVVKSRENLHAVNSVSGEEIIFPLDTWTVVRVPDLNLLTPTIVVDMVKRHVAAMLPTGAVTGGLLAELCRGDLNPTI